MGKLLAAVLLGLCSLVSHAQSSTVSEYGLKAVLFFKLPQFIYWPAERTVGAPVICVQGTNPFGAALHQLAQTGGTSADIRLVDSGGIAVCNVLFISRSEAGQIEQILQRAAARSILTVSDIPGFIRSGGMVELILDGDRIGISLNRRSALRQGIDFNAQLLRLAQRVEQ